MKPANQALHDLEQIARRIRERAAVARIAFPETPHTRNTDSPWDYPKKPVFDWKD